MRSPPIDRAARWRRVGFIAVTLLACAGLSRADDASLLEELRAGAVVLMRHAETPPGGGDPPGWRLDECASQRNLDAGGVAHAKRIGQWFADKHLPVSAVRNSPWCRTRDTALLAFGRDDDWSALGNLVDDRTSADAQATAVTQYIESLPPGDLIVLVSHGPTIDRIVNGQAHLAPGEAVVVRRGATAGAPLLVLDHLTVK